MPLGSPVCWKGCTVVTVLRNSRSPDGETNQNTPSARWPTRQYPSLPRIDVHRGAGAGTTCSIDEDESTDAAALGAGACDHDTHSSVAPIISAAPTGTATRRVPAARHTSNKSADRLTLSY